MNSIKPFCAIRPNPTITNKFCTNTITSYTKKEIKNILKSNSKTFLHIIRENIDLDKNLSRNNRLKKINIELKRFKKEGFIIKDKIPGLYINEITINQEKITGVIGVVPIYNYTNGKIKKHENTIRSREKTFKNYLKITRFNAEPVLLSYKTQDSLTSLIERLKNQKPTSETKFSQKEICKLWRVKNKFEILSLIKEFNKIPKFYIADGHHRSESSKLLHDEEKSSKTDAFMAFLVPENEIKIKEYNRIITDLNDHSPISFIEKLKLKFHVKKIEKYQPEKTENGFHMYFNGQFYLLSLIKKNNHTFSPLNKLEAYILQEHILKPILGIKNIRNDKRITYSYKSDKMESIKNQIDDGKFAVGFGLKAVTIDELKNVADADLVMPPKTSFIYPKLRSGVTIFEF
jgi:uncharacterized protein (DUF1015 family)